MIAIIDYDSGNISSISNMLGYIGLESVVTRDRKVIREASKIILPGVGAFDRGMQKLEKFDLVGVLEEQVLSQVKPVLGICLGMQLLGNGSEEGDKSGLGWIDMYSSRFSEVSQKVPHMGWNQIQAYLPNPLIQDDNQWFYFVHSYRVHTVESRIGIMTTDYGTKFTSGVMDKNILGVQFHPEKSHRFGMSLLAKFGAL